MQVAARSRFGPYELIAELGAGGMGQVWRARDTRLSRDVAIKFLPAEYAQDARAKLRLQREAHSISQLNHPRICTLLDVGDGYLVMELVVGVTVLERLRRGPMPLRDVLRYGAEIADALAAAHRAGIVHRDLKPANVMITKAGAKLLDFGIARAISSDSDHSTDTKITTAGTVIGTAPELAAAAAEAVIAGFVAQ